MKQDGKKDDKKDSKKDDKKDSKKDGKKDGKAMWFNPSSTLGSDQKDERFDKRRRTNSAPPFIGELPFRSYGYPPGYSLRLSSINERHRQNTPSDDETEEFPDTSPCPEAVAPCAKRDLEDTESDEDMVDRKSLISRIVFIIKYFIDAK